jgi:hypothetical protein
MAKLLAMTAHLTEELKSLINVMSTSTRWLAGSTRERQFILFSEVLKYIELKDTVDWNRSFVLRILNLAIIARKVGLAKTIIT